MLGPIIFSLYIQPLYEEIRKHTQNFHAYVDDNQFYVNCTTPEESIATINIISNAIENFLTAHKLKINMSKTEIIVFSPSRNSPLHDLNIKLNNHEIKSKSAVRNLGVTFDSKMSFEVQISNVCKACNLKLIQIAKNRKCFDDNSIKKLVEAVVLSKLNFACTLYSGLPNKLLNKLQKIQNFAARVITKTPKYAHITPVLKTLKWLPIREFIKYRLLTITYQCIYHEAPQYLKDILTLYNPPRCLRSTENHLLNIPAIKSTFGMKSFSFQASTLWNSIPTRLKLLNNVPSFKKALKEYLFDQHFEIQN